jgi:hypothetical protein
VRKWRSFHEIRKCNENPKKHVNRSVATQYPVYTGMEGAAFQLNLTRNIEYQMNFYN